MGVGVVGGWGTLASLAVLVSMWGGRPAGPRGLCAGGGGVGGRLIKVQRAGRESSHVGGGNSIGVGGSVE